MNEVMLVSKMFDKLKEQYGEYGWDVPVCAIGLKNLVMSKQFLVFTFGNVGITKRGRQNLEDFDVIYVADKGEDEFFRYLNTNKQENANRIGEEVYKQLGLGVRLNTSVMLVAQDVESAKKKEDRLKDFERTLRNQIDVLKKEIISGIAYNLTQENVTQGTDVTGREVKVNVLLENVLPSNKELKGIKKYWGLAVVVDLGKTKKYHMIYSNVPDSPLEPYQDSYVKKGKQIYQEAFNGGKRDVLGDFTVLWGDQELQEKQKVVVPYGWLLTRGYEEQGVYDKVGVRLNEYFTKEQESGSLEGKASKKGNSLFMYEYYSGLEKMTLLFSEVGIGTLDGKRIYAKGKEGPNLREAMVILTKLTGNSVFTYDILRVYDLRTNVETQQKKI